MCGLATLTSAPSCPRCGALLTGEEASLNLLLEDPVDDHTRQRSSLRPVAYLPAESAIPAPPAAIPAPPEPPQSYPRAPSASQYRPPPAGESSEPAPVASAGQRLSASLIDMVLLFTASFVILLAIGLFTSIIAAISESLIPLAQLLGWLALLCVPIGYVLVLNARGQTLGKRVVHIAVVDRASGRPIGIGRSAIRTLMMALMWLPLGLGFLSVPLSARLRGWHDQIADDIVVRMPVG